MTWAVALFCFFNLTLKAEPPHRALLQEAAAAAKAGDPSTMIAKLEAVRALRPDYPRVLLGLARAYAAAGKGDEAVACLRELADMGLVMNVGPDDAFAALRARPDFAAVERAFTANAGASTTSGDETAWAITDMDGIIEAVATHPATRETFFSDVRNRCIWVRDVSGPTAAMRRFSADSDGLLGVFALKFDATGQTLWAASAAVPEMQGYAAADQGRALLAEYDLASRRLRRTWAVPADGRPHVLGDFAFGPDGAIYATDSAAPVVWRLGPGGTRLEPWLESDDFVSLQGVAAAPDGRSLFLADYANGLWQVALDSGRHRLLRPPAHATFFGIDGLYAVPAGLIAVQNGVHPQRVLQITLDSTGQPTAAAVLRVGHPAMTDAALGEVVNGSFQLVANSGWSLAEGALTPRMITLLSTRLQP
ncbi:MAG: tetratricopeptide repeat protein [Opitutaceae bacterium]|nr:tetratricopeptide repeat protein [Opitutaceae bacterium]